MFPKKQTCFSLFYFYLEKVLPWFSIISRCHPTCLFPSIDTENLPWKVISIPGLYCSPSIPMSPPQQDSCSIANCLVVTSLPPFANPQVILISIFFHTFISCTVAHSFLWKKHYSLCHQGWRMSFPSNFTDCSYSASPSSADMLALLPSSALSTVPPSYFTPVTWFSTI